MYDIKYFFVYFICRTFAGVDTQKYLFARFPSLYNCLTSSNSEVSCLVDRSECLWVSPSASPFFVHRFWLMLGLCTFGEKLLTSPRNVCNGAYVICILSLFFGLICTQTKRQLNVFQKQQMKHVCYQQNITGAWRRNWKTGASWLGCWWSTPRTRKMFCQKRRKNQK